MSNLKETLISCICRADISEKHMQTLTLLVTESEHKLNSQPLRIPVKVKTLIGRKMGP